MALAINLFLWSYRFLSFVFCCIQDHGYCHHGHIFFFIVVWMCFLNLVHNPWLSFFCLVKSILVMFFIVFIILLLSFHSKISIFCLSTHANFFFSVADLSFTLMIVSAVLLTSPTCCWFSSPDLVVNLSSYFYPFGVK